MRMGDRYKADISLTSFFSISACAWKTLNLKYASFMKHVCNPFVASTSSVGFENVLKANIYSCFFMCWNKSYSNRAHISTFYNLQITMSLIPHSFPQNNSMDAMGKKDSEAKTRSTNSKPFSYSVRLVLAIYEGTDGRRVLVSTWPEDTLCDSDPSRAPKPFGAWGNQVLIAVSLISFIGPILTASGILESECGLTSMPLPYGIYQDWRGHIRPGKHLSHISSFFVQEFFRAKYWAGVLFLIGKGYVGSGDLTTLWFRTRSCPGVTSIYRFGQPHGCCDNPLRLASPYGTSVSGCLLGTNDIVYLH